MDNIIYYFSGRGNSLKTALDVSQRLDHSVLFPMRDGTICSAGPNADTIGIFTPVIDMGIPAYVLNFVDRLQVANKQAYIYAAVTNGGMPAAAMKQIRKCFEKKGLTLSAEFLVKFGAEWSASEEWQKHIDGITEIIRQKQIQKCTLSWKDKVLTAANPLAKLLIPSEDKKFMVGENCTGCGTCEKICPVKNIRLTDGKPEWLHSCEQCAACFSWCPQEAITGTNLAARTRFTNPEITLEQMLGKAKLNMQI